MKIVRVINSLDFGGIERVYEIVAKYNESPSGDLVFVALGKGGAAADVIKSLGFKVIVLGHRTAIPNFRLLVRITRLLRELRPDLVHSCGAEGNFYGQISAWLVGIRGRIAEEIGIPSQSLVARIIFGFVYKLSHGVVAVASSVADYLNKKNGVSRRKIHVVYNPVDTRLFEEVRAEGHARFTFLAVCRLHPIKNLGSLLKALAVIRNSHDVELSIVGDGEQRQFLESLCEQLGLTDVVKFWGYQPNPAPFFARSDAFVLPSFSEGHPVSMIEAMVAGLPVLVTKVGGASELIIDGVNGYLIDPNNVKDIVHKMEVILGLSVKSRNDVADRGRQLVVDRFTPAVYFRNLDEIYYKILHGN